MSAFLSVTIHKQGKWDYKHDVKNAKALIVVNVTNLMRVFAGD